MLLATWVRVADALAIPGFALAVWYFATREHKSVVEWLLLGFVTIGLVADIVFTLSFLFSGRRRGP